MGRLSFSEVTRTEGELSMIVCRKDHKLTYSYVSTVTQNNPTYEFWPGKAGGAIYMDFLNYTVPVNLFPLTWLMPDGKSEL